MALERNVGDRDRLVRGGLAVFLAAVAAWSFARGRVRLGGTAGVVALGLGFNAVTCFCGMNELLGIDTTRE